VQSIAGHQITTVKNRETIDLKVFWEGYKEPSWEGFLGFAKDTAEKVEKYVLKTMLRP
jgi:hypothetical protein